MVIKKKSAPNGMCARGLWQARQGMPQVQREQRDAVRKEAECKSLQSRWRPKRSRHMPQGKKLTATRFAQNPRQTLKVETATKARGHLDKADVATVAG